MADKFDVKVNDGTIERVETVTVDYKRATRPELSVDITRPYEVEAAGTYEATAHYSLNKLGTKAINGVKISVMGFFDACRAAYNAFKNAGQSGGITNEDKQTVQGHVNDYNGKVDMYNKVEGQTTSIVNSETKPIDGFDKSELEELLNKE